MGISNLMESISKLWPFSKVLDFSDEGYFVSPQTSHSDSNGDSDLASNPEHGEATEEIDVGIAFDPATVSLETSRVHAPVSYLTVSFSSLRSNHSS